MTRGFLYIAYGEKYRLEARRSACSLLKHNPRAKITLITHCSFEAPEFEQIIIKPMLGSYLDKVKYMKESPYDRTLFLDTDTYIFRNLHDLFGLLNYYDIAMSIESSISTEQGMTMWKDAPIGLKSATEFNTGVILFRNSQTVKKLFESWEAIYKQRQNIDAHDQPSMAIALSEVPLRLTVLPSEFNLRATFPQVLYREVSIIHARLRNYKKTLKQLNSLSGISRNWLPASHKCIPIYGNSLHLLMTKVKFFFKPIIYRIRVLLNLEGDLIQANKGRFKN